MNMDEFQPAVIWMYHWEYTFGSKTLTALISESHKSNQFILVRWPPLDNAANLHCWMSDATTRRCSRHLLFRKDQSLTSVATTINLFVACLLNYSYEMCILVLTDHSGNSATLKRSLEWRGAEVNFWLYFKFPIQIRTPGFRMFYFILSWTLDFNILDFFLKWRSISFPLLTPICFPLRRFPSGPAILNFVPHLVVCLFSKKCQALMYFRKLWWRIFNTIINASRFLETRPRTQFRSRQNYTQLLSCRSLVCPYLWPGSHPMEPTVTPWTEPTTNNYFMVVQNTTVNMSLTHFYHFQFLKVIFITPSTDVI